MIVTISRQAASRGDQVARLTAELLDLPLVTQETVARASMRMHLQREDLSRPERAERLGERLATIALDMAGSEDGDPDWALAPHGSMDDPGYRRVVETMVRRLGAADRCLILGYPGQALLTEPASAVHALVIAPLAIRVQRMIMREDLPAAVAERIVRESDRDRLAFYQRLYDMRWNDPSCYDCVLNTARMSLEQAASTIALVAGATFNARAGDG